MKILHVASFSGNVGDNANHSGLRRKLAEVFNNDVFYDEIEMRRFYKNYDGKDKLFFDSEFAGIANKYDLVILGGGNFFEIWLEVSSTGCTIDMGSDVVDLIKTKVLFFGLGFDRNKGYSKQTLDRFLSFIKNIQDKSRFMVTVRNDGSLEQFITSYGMENSSLIQKVPDGGFFVKPKEDISVLFPKNRVNIILSLAMDMLTVRFGRENEKNGYKLLVESFSKYIVSMVEHKPTVFFTFMPHIYSDLGIINAVIGILPDYIRRNFISVGPYLIGNGAEDVIFSNYREADLVIGMRFHANVCSIGMEVPTIGIGTYTKIIDLYRELGLLDHLIIARGKAIDERLISKTFEILDNVEKIREVNRAIVQKLNNEMDRFLSNFKKFVS